MNVTAESYLYDAAIKEFVKAYFSEYSISSLKSAFDRVAAELARQKLIHQKDHLHHSQELTRFFMALLLHTLVEHGSMRELFRYSGVEHAITSSVCNIDNYEMYCEKLSDRSDYSGWTYMILFLIARLRENKIVYVRGEQRRVDPLVNMEGTSPEFTTSVILLLYGVLMLRLVLCTTFFPGIDRRYEIEICMFLTILSFYYDYVYFTKNFSRNANLQHWDLLLEQVETRYVKPSLFFIALKFRYEPSAYLQQDNIVPIYNKIYQHYLKKYEDTLSKSGLLVSQTIDVEEIYHRIYNINMDSISMLYNRWFRYVVYNKYFQGYADTMKTLYGLPHRMYEGIHESVTLGWSIYTNIYSDRWPQASKGIGLTVGIVVFAGSVSQSFVKSGLRWGWNQIAAGIVYAFSKSDLMLPKLKIIPKFEPPTGAGRLIWERSPNGSHSVIYRETPLPIIRPIETGIMQKGGRSRASNKRSQHLKVLGEALRKGVLKSTLPVEMQIYLQKKLRLTTVMTGGGGHYDPTQDDLPPGWTREVIDTADDLAFFREDEDQRTMQLVIPMSSLEKEALENTEFVNIRNPADNVLEPPKTMSSLPTITEETEPPQLPDTVDQIELSYDNSPPVDPAVSLPTLSNEDKMYIYEKSVSPIDRQFTT
jgi:hypothetical protein